MTVSGLIREALRDPCGRCSRNGPTYRSLSSGARCRWHCDEMWPVPSAKYRQSLKRGRQPRTQKMKCSLPVDLSSNPVAISSPDGGSTETVPSAGVPSVVTHSDACRARLECHTQCELVSGPAAEHIWLQSEHRLCDSCAHDYRSEVPASTNNHHGMHLFV